MKITKQVLENIQKRAKEKWNYPSTEIGANLVAMSDSQSSSHTLTGYTDSLSMEIHKVEDVNRELYTVDGSLHPRNDPFLNLDRLREKERKRKRKRDRDRV